MKKIDLKTLHNAEHFALMSDFSVLLTEANLAPMAELKTALEKGLAQEDAAQLQIRKSEHTAELISLDDKRDSLYRGLVLRVQSEAYNPTEDIRKSAEKLAILVGTYGNFTKHNYQKETTEIQNLVADFKSAEYLPLVQKIGLEQWVEWLETANNAFHKTYTDRRDEYANAPTFDLKNIRKEQDEIFRKICQTADALAILQPSEALKTFIAKAEASITKWNEVLAQRSGRKTKKGEETTKVEKQE